ncbi:HepT-like ribonuclease domain-containing protein [Haloferula sp.]
MKHMVGFRNVAVHSYQQLQRPILEAILQQHLGDFEAYLGELSKRA